MVCHRTGRFFCVCVDSGEFKELAAMFSGSCIVGGWEGVGISCRYRLGVYTSPIYVEFICNLSPASRFYFKSAITCAFQLSLTAQDYGKPLKPVELECQVNHPFKRRRVLSHIKQFKTAIAFLQETHIRSSDNLHLQSRWVEQHFHSNFQAKARGVSIFINQNIPFECHNTVSDINGQYIIVSGKLYDICMSFFSSLPDLSSYSLILGGDFNCWLDPVLDRSSSNPGLISKSAFTHSVFLI